MGTSIIIPGADFRTNALDHKGTIVKQYLYGISDEQLNHSNQAWTLTAMGFSITDQSPIQGKTLYGVRLYVSTPGQLTIFKASSYDVVSSNALTEVATISTDSVGIQDLDFSSPITLGSNEFIVLGSTEKGVKTLIGNTMSGTSPYDEEIHQGFWYLVGSDGNPRENTTTKAFNADFYHYVELDS